MLFFSYYGFISEGGYLFGYLFREETKDLKAASYL